MSIELGKVGCSGLLGLLPECVLGKIAASFVHAYCTRGNAALALFTGFELYPGVF